VSNPPTPTTIAPAALPSRSFRSWLVAQRDRDDATGDIAKDVLADDCASGLSSPRSLRRHILSDHNPCDAALRAFDRAVQEWDAAKSASAPAAERRPTSPSQQPTQEPSVTGNASTNNHHTLPLASGAIDVRDIAHAYVALLGVAPPPISTALLAMAYRAPLGQIDFSGFLIGPSGTGKTELAALAQQHYGAGMGRLHLPSWSSTGSALQFMAHQAKDALLVIDDFAPIGKVGEVRRMHLQADLLLGGQDATLVTRRRRGSTAPRTPMPPRGLMLATGERLPHGPSLRARMLVLAIRRGDVRWDRLTVLQEIAARGLFAASMAGYLQWLAPTYGQEAERVSTRLRQLEQVVIRGAADRRTPRMIASLAIGFERFLQFAEAIGAISPQQRQEQWARGWNALVALGEDQAQHFVAPSGRVTTDPAT
jgi:hypothetical protein